MASVDRRRVEPFAVGGRRVLQRVEPGELLADLVGAQHGPPQLVTEGGGEGRLPRAGQTADDDELNAGVEQVAVALAEVAPRLDLVAGAAPQAGDLRPHQRPVGDVVVLERPRVRLGRRTRGTSRGS